MSARIDAELVGDSGPRSVLPFFSTSGWTVVTTSSTIADDVEGLEEQLHLAGFDLRQVEDVVDQRLQVLAGRMDLLQIGNGVVLVQIVAPAPAASRCSR